MRSQICGSGGAPETDVLENGKPLGPVVVYPSSDSHYLLSCLSDTWKLERKEFDAQFESAEAELEHGKDREKLQFICLCLNDKADDKQFKQGANVLERYLADHPDSGEEMQGFQILVSRLDEEIMNRWSAWKSLLNDKVELNKEVESLKITVEEQKKQIEQLKNIEKIIKSREGDQR